MGWSKNDFILCNFWQFKAGNGLSGQARQTILGRLVLFTIALIYTLYTLFLPNLFFSLESLSHLSYLFLTVVISVPSQKAGYLPPPPFFFFVNLVAKGEDRGITHWLGLVLCHHYSHGHEWVRFQWEGQRIRLRENSSMLSSTSNHEGGFGFELNILVMCVFIHLKF